MHKHSHNLNRYDKAFALGLALNISFIIAEIVFGFLANSTALLADAGRNFSYVISLLIAWTASGLALLKPTERRTYGGRKVSVMGAFINALILLFAMSAITLELIHRFRSPEHIEGSTVIVVASIGASINTATAQVKDYLSGLPGIKGVHDLHIWAMSTTETALTVHLIKPSHQDDDSLIKDRKRTP